jgi:ABC-type polysaccharide/polyol phosphate export permease
VTATVGATATATAARWRVWRQRADLVAHLARREFSLRYQDSALGVLWSLLLPLAQLLVLVFVFQRVIPLGIEAYPAFVLSALLPWTWFSTSVSAAGNLFTGNRDLVRRPGFAPAILVMVNALSNLLSLLVSLPLLVLLLAWYGRPPGAALLLLPVLLATQVVLTVGIGVAVATLNVFYRDVQHLVSAAVLLLFYVTPVFYRTADLGAEVRWLFAVNPVAVLIAAYRTVFFEQTLPASGPLLLAAASSAGVCVLAAVLYRRRRHDIVDAL